MLVDELQALSTRIRSLAASDVDARGASQFQERAHELQEPTLKLRVATARIVELKKRGITVNVPASKSAVLKNTIVKIASEYERDPASIIAPNSRWRFQAKPTIQSLPNELENSTREAWEQHVRSVRPDTSEWVLLLLSKLPDGAPIADAIRQLETEFDQLETTMPTDLTIDRPVAVAEELLRLRKNLPEAPEFIRDLLGSMENGTATLAHMTEEATVWFRENDLISFIAVSWKSR